MPKSNLNLHRLDELNQVSTAILTAKPVFTSRMNYRGSLGESSPFLTEQDKIHVKNWCKKQHQHPVFKQSNAVLKVVL